MAMKTSEEWFLVSRDEISTCLTKENICQGLAYLAWPFKFEEVVNLNKHLIIFSFFIVGQIFILFEQSVETATFKQKFMWTTFWSYQFVFYD